MRAIQSIPSVSAALLAASLSACSSEAPAPGAPPAVQAAAALQPPAGAARAGAPDAPAPPRDLDVEASAKGRDPFQPLTTERVPRRDERPRKSGMYAVDQLRLAAIVGRVDMPRAMLIDPRGKGWVVTQGELLGKPEVVHAGATDRPASWRVDRIRERDVVLVRDDSGAPGAAGTQRVLALPEDPVALAEGDEFAAR